MSNPNTSNAWNSLFFRNLLLSRAKLRESSRVSALLAGFAMVAIVELQITTDNASGVPEYLLITFTVLACLLVTVHIIAVMISTCILPHLDCYVSLFNGFNDQVQAPHHRLRMFIEIAWIFSTVLGIVLFLAVVVLACWVKFWNISRTSAFAGTAVVVPAFLVFVAFTALFYFKLTAHKVECANEMLQTLDMHMHFLEAGDILPIPMQQRGSPSVSDSAGVPQIPLAKSISQHPINSQDC